MNEVERKLHHSMEVVQNIVHFPKLLHGASRGATEMAVSMGLRQVGLEVQRVQLCPFLTVGEAMEVIPCTLAQNCCCISVI